MAGRIAFYIRLSHQDGEARCGAKDESNSITGQRKLLMAYVSEHDEFAGCDVVEYFDDGVSGSLFAGRDAFQDMLQDAKDGRFSCLLVKDFSRLGRDYLEVGNFMEYVFPAMGLRFISVGDDYDSLNLRGMTGGMDVAFKNLIHQMYAMDGSKKCKTARKTRNVRGEYTAGIVPYGYRKDAEDFHRMVTDEAEAAVVREIFEMAADGKTYASIARNLNDRKEPTPFERKCDVQGWDGGRHRRFSPKRVWTTSTVGAIIRNTTYRGEMVQNKYETVGYGDAKKTVIADRKNWSIIQDGVPAIVDAKLFEAANLRGCRRKKRTGATEKNLFTCGICGRKLIKTSPNGRYVCPVRKVKSHTDCERVDMRVEAAKSLVLKTVKEIALIVLSNREYYEEQEKKRIRRINDEMKQCEDEKERLEKCVLSSYEEYAGGAVSRDDYICGRKECRASIDSIDERLDMLWKELHRTVRVDDEAIMECRMLQRFDSEMLAKVLEKAVIYDDRHLDVVFDADDVFKAEIPEDAVW